MGLQLKDANGVIQTVPLYIDPTYGASEITITAVTTATDQVALYGSSGTVARLKHFGADFTQIAAATAATVQVVQLVRRSTALSGAGATVNVTTTSTSLFKFNQNLAAPACTLSRYTGTAPTIGTSIGVVKSANMIPSTAASTTVSGTTGRPIVWDFSTRVDRACEILGLSSGNGDYVAVNFGGVTQITTWDYEIEWEEGLV